MQHRWTWQGAVVIAAVGLGGVTSVALGAAAAAAHGVHAVGDRAVGDRAIGQRALRLDPERHRRAGHRAVPVDAVGLDAVRVDPVGSVALGVRPDRAGSGAGRRLAGQQARARDVGARGIARVRVRGRSGAQSSAPGSAGGPRSASPTTSADGSASGGARAAARRAGTSAAARRAGPLTRRERILRATVRRYGACLGRLPALERRVLVLRAALGRSEPRSRPRVAALTETTVTRVARVERRGLHRLRALGHRGGCAAMAPATLIFASAGMTGSRAADAPGDRRAGVVRAGPAQRRQVRARVGRRRGPADGLQQRGAADRGPGPGTLAVGRGGIDPVVVIAPLLLLGYLGWVVRGELKKS